MSRTGGNVVSLVAMIHRNNVATTIIIQKVARQNGSRDAFVTKIKKITTRPNKET